MTRQEQKQEAIERMKMLKLHKNAIREFEKNDIINKSEHGGILYWLEDNEIELVKEFEMKYDAVVYHVIHNYTDIGELLSLIHVSKIELQWEYERNELKNGCTFAYVINLNDNWCTEFGSIGIKPQFGGLMRTM